MSVALQRLSVRIGVAATLALWLCLALLCLYVKVPEAAAYKTIHIQLAAMPGSDSDFTAASPRSAQNDEASFAFNENMLSESQAELVQSPAGYFDTAPKSQNSTEAALPQVEVRPHKGDADFFPENSAHPVAESHAESESAQTVVTPEQTHLKPVPSSATQTSTSSALSNAKKDDASQTYQPGNENRFESDYAKVHSGSGKTKRASRSRFTSAKSGAVLIRVSKIELAPWNGSPGTSKDSGGAFFSGGRHLRSEPVISIAKGSLESSRTVFVQFLVDADGTVPLNSISISPAALLPSSVQGEIRQQISAWQFDADLGAPPAKASFTLTIQPR
ncbi:MAG: hypothetical protein J1D88_07930 [Treponema sp.]|nr:hypothetical protein [Treponema sp.]